MNKLTVRHDVGGIQGLCVIEPHVFQDNSGYLFESFNRNKFIEEQLVQVFVQDNEAFSKRGVLRGMHVNVKHPQGKLVRVAIGKIYDVVVDLRKGSKTYKKWFGIELSEENKKQLYIPEGMGHGYLALKDAYVLFKVTTHYIPNDEIGFAWDSKELGIEWPMTKIKIIQNEKDANNIDISEIRI